MPCNLIVKDSHALEHLGFMEFNVIFLLRLSESVPHTALHHTSRAIRDLAGLLDLSSFWVATCRVSDVLDSRSLMLTFCCRSVGCCKPSPGEHAGPPLLSVLQVLMAALLLITFGCTAISCDFRDSKKERSTTDTLGVDGNIIAEAFCCCIPSA